MCVCVCVCVTQPYNGIFKIEPVSSNKVRNMWKKYMYSCIAMEVFVKSNFEVKRNTSGVCSFATESD